MTMDWDSDFTGIEETTDESLKCERCGYEDLAGGLTKTGKAVCRKCFNPKSDPYTWHTDYEDAPYSSSGMNIELNPSYEGSPDPLGLYKKLIPGYINPLFDEKARPVTAYEIQTGGARRTGRTSILEMPGGKAYYRMMIVQLVKNEPGQYTAKQISRKLNVSESYVYVVLNSEPDLRDLWLKQKLSPAEQEAARRRKRERKPGESRDLCVRDYVQRVHHGNELHSEVVKDCALKGYGTVKTIEKWLNDCLACHAKQHKAEEKALRRAETTKGVIREFKEEAGF